MSLSLSQAVEKTLRYGDLFDFPMTELEVRQYLIGQTIKNQPLPTGHYQQVGDHYVLSRRTKLVRARLQKDIYTKRKIARAIKLANLLRVFPGVRLVGLTGSVAASNAARADDIDIMVVTAKGRIWSTRALIFLTMGLLGLKRPDRTESHVDNQFCFNLWLEDSNLGLRMKNQDLYTAHEVCLMKPLLGGATYQHFLHANNWSKQYLPNFSSSYGAQLIQDSFLIQDLGHVIQSVVEVVYLGLLGWVLEPLAKVYSKRRIQDKNRHHHYTDVTVSDQQLMFHPSSPRQNILRLFH